MSMEAFRAYGPRRGKMFPASRASASAIM